MSDVRFFLFGLGLGALCLFGAGIAALGYPVGSLIVRVSVFLIFIYIAVALLIALSRRGPKK